LERVSALPFRPKVAPIRDGVGKSRAPLACFPVEPIERFRVVFDDDAGERCDDLIGRNAVERGCLLKQCRDGALDFLSRTHDGVIGDNKLTISARHLSSILGA
jgi:hypothetical protein